MSLAYGVAMKFKKVAEYLHHHIPHFLHGKYVISFVEIFIFNDFL